MEQNKTGEFISALRKEKGYTQQELANMLNITNKAVSKWERGDGYPEITILPELANIFGISVDELLSGQRKEKTIYNAAKTDNKSNLEFINKFSFVLSFGIFIAGSIIAYLIFGFLARRWRFDIIQDLSLTILFSSCIIGILLYLIMNYKIMFKDKFKLTFNKKLILLIWILGLATSYLLGIFLTPSYRRDEITNGIMFAFSCFVILKVFTHFYWWIVCKRMANSSYLSQFDDVKPKFSDFFSAIFYITMLVTGYYFFLDYNRDIIRPYVFLTIIIVYMIAYFIYGFKKKDYKLIAYSFRDAVVSALFALQIGAFAADRFFRSISLTVRLSNFNDNIKNMINDNVLMEQIKRNGIEITFPETARISEQWSYQSLPSMKFGFTILYFYIAALLYIGSVIIFHFVKKKLNKPEEKQTDIPGN